MLLRQQSGVRIFSKLYIPGNSELYSNKHKQSETKTGGKEWNLNSRRN